MELADHFVDLGRHRVEEGLVDRHGLPLEVEPDVGVVTGVIDRARRRERLPSDQGLQVDADLVLLADQSSPDMIERILEEAVEHRDVEAVDAPAVTERPPFSVADELDRGIDPPRGGEVLPEREKLGRSPGAEPLIEFKVVDLEYES